MNICFYPHNWGYLNNFEPVLKYLDDKNIQYDIIISGPPNDSYEKYKNKYKNKLIELYDNKKIEYYKKLSSIPFFGFFIKAFFIEKYTKKFLKKKNYTHFITSDDRTYFACILLKCVKKNTNAKTILYPVEDIQLVSNLLISRAKITAPLNVKRKIMQIIAKRIFLLNFLNYKNKSIAYFPSRNVFHYKLTNLAPIQPWIRGTNKINKVAVNSETQKKENIKYGMKKEIIKTTGFPPHDKMVNYLKNKNQFLNIIKNKYKIKPKEKIFFIVGTHFAQFFDIKEWPELFITINNVIKTIINTLDGNYCFILKVHPRMNLETQKKSISKSIRNKIIFIKNEYDAYQLISISDVIFNFYSSTVIGSLASKTPIFAYKIPKMPSFEEMHDQFESVFQILNNEQLKNYLSQLKDSAITYSTIEKKRERDRDKFGLFDGGNTSRFINLIKTNN